MTPCSGHGNSTAVSVSVSCAKDISRFSLKQRNAAQSTPHWNMPHFGRAAVRLISAVQHDSRVQLICYAHPIRYNDLLNLLCLSGNKGPMMQVLDYGTTRNLGCRWGGIHASLPLQASTVELRIFRDGRASAAHQWPSAIDCKFSHIARCSTTSR